MTTLPITATIKINDGTVAGLDNFSLVTAPYKIKLAPDVALSGQEPTVTEHDSDDGPPDVINLEEENRVWKFNLQVSGTTKNDVLTSINTLKRHIQGKQSTAYQAFRNGSQPDVTFEMKLDSSTPTTTFIVQYASIKDNSSFYTIAAQKNNKALDIDMTLTCKPAGRGANISLRNDLASSPHMLEDSDSDGLADGWAIQGTPTTQINVNRWVVGGQCQQLITNIAGGEGMSQLVTTGAGDDVVAYAFVQGSGDPFDITLLDGAFAVIEAKTFDPSSPTTNADMVLLAEDGTLWYRHSVSGSNVANDVRLRILRTGGAATQATTMRIDACYLELNQTVIPSPFCSTSSIGNRYDPTAGSEERINYFDVALVPGDMPAEVISVYDVTGANKTSGVFTGSRYNFNREEAADYLHVIDNTGDLGGTIFGPAPWPTVIDAAALGGSYIHTGTGAPTWGSTVTFFISMAADLAQSFHSRQVRMFGLCKKSGAGTISVVSVENIANTNGTATLSPTSITIDATWLFIDLGLWNPNSKAFEIAGDASTNSGLTWTVESTDTVTDFQIDAIWMFPVSDGGEHAVITTGDSWNTDAGGSKGALTIDGSDKTAFVSSAMDVLIPSGSLFQIKPQVFNRIIVSRWDTALSMDIADTFDVTLSITPIASHLIGES